MNEKQRAAVEFVVSGHNLVLLGKAGTGKTYTVKRIVERCTSVGKTCAVTATTGIACSLYPNYLNAMTIHRWSGIGDGRFGPNEIQLVVANSIKYKTVHDRIQQTDVLIIDEVSMLSKRVLECIDSVCSIRNPSLLFGGIQIVLVGDILQLAPVPCPRYYDDGAFYFESHTYSKAFPHRIQLDEVYRQTDQCLVRTIEQVSLGTIDLECVNLLKSLSRPLPNTGSEPVILYATNDLVNDLNHSKILGFSGDLFEFTSTDTGEQRYMKEITASKKLWLKIGIPVILIKNLSDQLVNGLGGNVRDIKDGKVLVDFVNVEETIYIEQVKFEVFDPKRNCVVATRKQIPLQPAFALTIHKSQGMTLERVQVDCKGIFKAGQLGVAIGRARSLDGLRVINYSNRACMKQPQHIINYLSTEDNLSTIEDRLCCIYNKRETLEYTDGIASTTSTNYSEIGEYQPDVNDLEDDLNDVIATIDADEECRDVVLPVNISLDDIIDKTKAQIIVTENQVQNNVILERLDFKKLEVFVKQQYIMLTSLINKCKCLNSGQIMSKDLGDFFTQQHTYSVSAEFKMHSLKLFQTEENFSHIHQRICTKIYVLIREFIMNEKAKAIQATSSTVSKRSITAASRSRIRYIGGYCIAKVKHKFITKKNTHRFSNKKLDIDEYEKSKCAVDILNYLSDHEQNVIATTVEPSSLLDISRRQNFSRGLTNIPDCVFNFFITLTEKCLHLLTDDNLNKFGETMFMECLNNIKSSYVYDYFTELCSRLQRHSFIHDHDNTVEGFLDLMIVHVHVVEILFHEIVKYHLKVMFNQFRKDTIENLHIQKKMAHRKQVRVQGNTSNKPYKSISNNTKPMDGEEPGTSEFRSIADEIACRICHACGGQSDWVQCDTCKLWLHRNCAGLKHHMKWKKFQKKNSKFLCKYCE